MRFSEKKHQAWFSHGGRTSDHALLGAARLWLLPRAYGGDTSDQGLTSFFKFKLAVTVTQAGTVGQGRESDTAPLSG